MNDGGNLLNVVVLGYTLDAGHWMGQQARHLEPLQYVRLVGAVIGLLTAVELVPKREETPGGRIGNCYCCHKRTDTPRRQGRGSAPRGPDCSCTNAMASPLRVSSVADPSEQMIASAGDSSPASQEFSMSALSRVSGQRQR